MINKLISRLSVKKKLSLIIIILLIPLFLAIAVTLSIYGLSISSALESKLSSSSKSVNDSFSYLSRQLTIYAKMISKHHDVSRGAYFNNTGSVLKYIIPVKKEIGLDIIDVYNRDSVIIARAQNPDEFNIDDKNKYVKLAQKGVDSIYIEEIQDGFILKTTVPVFHINIPTKIVGIVTVGYNLNIRFAKELQKISGTDVLFINGDQIYSSSFSDKLKYPSSLINKNKFEYDKKTELDINQIAPNIGKPGNFKIYIAINNSIIRNTFKRIIFLIIAFFFITATLALWVTIKIGSNMKNSIKIIHSATREIEKENYNLTVDLQTKDEFQDLADTLNVMTKNIDSSFKTIKNQTEKIEELTNFLSNIIESMPSILITIDKNGIITQWNKAAIEFSGISPAQSIGKVLWDIMPEFSKYREYIDIVMSERKSIDFFRESFKEKKKFIYNISLFPIKKKGMGLRIDNISELEKKEEQLRQAQKMEIVGTLAGGLAHDFNNVLGGISGALSLIQFKIKRDPDIQISNILEYFNIIEESTERAADMVLQLLNLSRKTDIDFSIIDLNKSIKRIIRILNNTIDKRVEIISNLGKDPSIILGNANQIDQVLLNLSVNASHAMTIMRPEMQKYGGKLTFEVKKIYGEVHFLLQHPEAENLYYWKLSVSDTGIGMDEKTISKIFDPFFTTKEKKAGTGLGLSMVYNIVNKHNGFIDVYSEKNNGTVFNLYFPVNKEIEETPDKAENDELVSGEGLILVIDDEQIMQNMATQILEECGYETITASDGEEGIKYYKEMYREIKAVVLDMSMPKLSGKETFSVLNEINPDVKILLVSGFKQNGQIEEMLKLGVKKFLQKPFTAQSLALSVWEITKDENN